MILCHRRKGSLDTSHLPSHGGLPNSFATECRRPPQGKTPRESSHMKSRLQLQSSQKASSTTTAKDEHSFPLHSNNPRNDCSANAEHPCQQHQRYLQIGTRVVQVINRHTDRSRLKLVDPRGVWFTRLQLVNSINFDDAVNKELDWTSAPGGRGNCDVSRPQLGGRTQQYPDSPME